MLLIIAITTCTNTSTNVPNAIITVIAEAIDTKAFLLLEYKLYDCFSH